MSFFKELKARLTRRSSSDRIHATPDVFAACAVTVAFNHYNSLRRRSLSSDNAVIIREWVDQITDIQWAQVSAELLRAYFGLASLWVGNFLQDDDLSSLYGRRMIEFLRRYPGEEAAWETAFVRDVFADEGALESAIACYVRGQLSQEDSAAIEDCRTMLSGSHSSEQPGLIIPFCLTLQVRLSRHLGIDGDKDVVGFMQIWIETVAGVTTAWKELFSKVEPVFTDHTAASLTTN